MSRRGVEPRHAAALDAYLLDVVARVRAVLADELVGVYAGGSYALGAYEAGRSDIDVTAVARSRVPRALKDRLVAALRHESLPCPARGLEFVLYRLDAVREASAAAAFELNLNTGAGMAFRVDYEPDPREAHWFPIDRSILSRSGVALTGPRAGELFADVPRNLLIPVLLRALEWHGAEPVPPDDAVLNACRSWRYAAEGVWSSKPDAGRWALAEMNAPAVVATALAAREDAGDLDPGEVARFVRHVAREVERGARR